MLYVPPGEPHFQPLASQDTDEESETVEPRSRVSNRSTLLQSKENPQNQKRKENNKGSGEAKRSTNCQKKHESMDSDEDDEEPQNQLGTSSTSQPFVPVLPLNQGPAASSQGPAAHANSVNENSEKSDEYRARSHLCILAVDEHWTVSHETHKYAAAAGSFCFVTTVNGEQQDFNNLTSFPSVQRSLCLEEVTDVSSSTRVELPKRVDKQTSDMLERCMVTCEKAAGARAQMRSCARMEASAQEGTMILQAVCLSETLWVEILVREWTFGLRS